MKEEKKELNTEQLRQKLEECQRLKDEYLAGWQRSRADLLNYKKEEMERVGDLLKYANEGLILRILPILDNFDLADRQTIALSEEKAGMGGQEKENIEQLIQGFLQIKTQILDFLKGQGVEEIKTIGERFDPNLAEVVEEIEMENKESGMVIEETQKGYTINGRLFRPAKVRVTK